LSRANQGSPDLPESVMPRLGLGIHEFRSASPLFAETDSWIPRPSLGMTIEFEAAVSPRTPRTPTPLPAAPAGPRPPVHAD
jgi:hypothetical protein